MSKEDCGRWMDLLTTTNMVVVAVAPNVLNGIGDIYRHRESIGNTFCRDCGYTYLDRRGGGDGDASRHRQERPQPRLRHHLCDYDLTEWDLYCETTYTHRGQRGGGDGGAECPRRGRQHHQ